MTKGQQAYQYRIEGRSWPEICTVMGYDGYRAIDRAINIAKRYAQHNGKQWPPPVYDRESQENHDCGEYLLVDGQKASCGVCKASFEWSDADDGWLEQ